MKKLVLLGLFLGLSGLGLRAQVAPINDDFEVADPCQSGDWICYDDLRWVPPDADPCDATVEPDHSVQSALDPQCNLFLPGEGYVLVTADFGNQGGSMFRTDPVEYNNFKLTAEVELRGGHAKTRPADGMCIVIIGDAGNGAPAGTGTRGGGMGAPGLADTAGPMATPALIFEFDNWNCNGSDNPGPKTGLKTADDNHVAFHYSPNGFVAVDDMQKNDEAGTPSNDVIRHIGPKLNGVETGVQAGKWLFEVFVQDGVVACNLTNLDVGFPKTRMYTYTIPDYQPFEGYLGVTASTGGADQNQILHSVKIETLPGNFCLKPPFDADRKIVSPHSDTRQASPTNPAGTTVPVWRTGDVLDVSITLRNVRANEPPRCLTPTDCFVNETVPAGWTATNISDGGSFAAGKVQWHVQNAAIAEGKVLSYKITAVDNTFSACFSASLIENVALSEPNGVGGDSCIDKDAPFDSCGGIRTWNILGGFGQDGFNNPGDDNMRKDYMTDGAVTEADFIWFAGAAIQTDFLGAAASSNVVGGANGWNPGGVPTVFAWNDADSLVEYEAVFGQDLDSIMAYSQCYVINNTGADLPVNMGVSSDDSVQVLLNGTEVWVHSIPRGGASACGPQDIVPDGIVVLDKPVLLKGENNLIVKTFEGGGGWNFSLRFQDDAGLPITQNLDVKLVPSGVCITPAMSAVRSLNTGETVLIQGKSFPTYSDGKTYDVSIALSNPRGTSGACNPPGAITLVETVPVGWVPSSASNSGAINNNAITWSLNGGSLPASLTYKVKAVGTTPEVGIGGIFSDALALGKYSVSGNGLLFSPTQFSDQGFIKNWLLLGPFTQPTGLSAAPGLANMRKDHLTDEGANQELTVQPRAGDQVQTHYGPPTCAAEGAACKAPPKARSTGIAEGLGDAKTRINPDKVPTWAEWRDRDDTINFDDYYGGNIDNVMMYAVTYVNVAADVSVDLGVGSDDSVQVFLDGQEVHINNIARGSGQNAVDDIVSQPSLNPLGTGCHILMVKVFEGGGGHVFRVRFQDTAGTPVTDGISISLNPDCSSTVAEICDNGKDDDGNGKTDCADAACSSAPNCGGRFHRGDTDNNGQLQLTDAVRILGFLFLGGVSPTCLDAADTDGNNQLQLTDAVRILGFLFLGGVPPVAPGPPPAACGQDNDANHLGCATYDKC